MIAINAPLVFGLLLVVGSLLLSWRHTARRIRAIRQEMAQLDQQIAAAGTSIRKIARESLHVRRLTAAQAERERQLSRDCAEVEAAIADFRRTASPLVVLDERKTVGDRLWQVPVTRIANGTSQPWRTFLVWASDPDRARLKIATRYPPKSGHSIGPATERSGLPEAAQ